MTTPKRTKEISAAAIYIENRLAEKLSISEIAQAVGLSSFHFQRLFFASVGESVAEYIKRRRMEHAAIVLTQDETRPVIDIALETGFDTHSAFSRAFKSHFGLAPSDFRESRPDNAPGSYLDNRPFLVPSRQKQLNIAVDLVELPKVWLLYRQQSGVVDGSYFGRADDLQKGFAELAALHGEQIWAYCGAYQGGPAAFSDDAAIGCYGGLFDSEPTLGWSDLCEPLPAGKWAVFQHYGKFEHLFLTWNMLTRNWLPQSGFSFRHSWAFETYIAAPETITEKTASAQIYLPVQ